MMSCREFVERTTEHVEGRLSFGERVSMRLHWLACSVCRAFLRQMRETAHATHAAADSAADPLRADLEEKLLRALDDPPR